MSQPNNQSVSVIGSQFTAPNPLEVKVVTNCKGTLVITDDNENILLKVTPCDGLSCRRRLLMDANDTPIVTIDEDMHTGQHLKKQKLDKFMVTISPNVDYAFAVALFVIVDAMESPYKNERVAAGKTTVEISNALLDVVTYLTRPN
ncbi:uncharacterized protein [Rutidosis leptorrhynchoides]|uniref:uncharacterized protein n=1 Tax=Rutidosis leptorrhynchoides TaxID=125765 RepID=UPI003A998C45